MSLTEQIERTTWNQKITMLRNIQGLTQKQFADKIGTTPKNLWMWELGKSYPRESSKKAIARACNVKESEIFMATK